MFSLSPLTDLTRFRYKKLKKEVYLISQDGGTICHGILLAARSPTFAQILEKSKEIPTVTFLGGITELKVCLDLIYGGSVLIGRSNFKSIYNFGKRFEINDMMEGVLAWIANDLAYKNFWYVYLELKNLQTDTSSFESAVRRYMGDDDNGFLASTTTLCRDTDENTVTAVIDLLSTIIDIKLLSVIVDVFEITLLKSPGGTKNNEHLQTVVSSTVAYIANYLRLNSGATINKACYKQTLTKASNISTKMETLRTINGICLDTRFETCRPSPTTKADLNRSRVRELTAIITPYDVIRNFADVKDIHPCVVVEIILKWWGARVDRDEFDMGFLKPIITKIQYRSSCWYELICENKSYKYLMKTLKVSSPLVTRYMHYYMRCVKDDDGNAYDNKQSVIDSIRKGDGTPAKLMELEYSDDMERYIDEVPEFYYNTVLVPPYGDGKYHWFMSAEEKHVSFVTTSQKELLAIITNAKWIELCLVVPLQLQNTI